MLKAIPRTWNAAALRYCTLTLRTLILGGCLSLTAGAHAAGLKYAPTEEPARYAVRITAAEPEYTDILKGDVKLDIAQRKDGLATATTGVLQSSQRTNDGLATFTKLGSRLTHLSFGAPAMASAFNIDPSGSATAPAASAAKTTPELPPFMLGDLSRILLQPLSSNGASPWELDRDCAIIIQPADRRSGSKPIILPAHEHAIYNLGDTTAERAQISERYEVKTNELVNGAPRVQVTTDGFVTFDTRTGIPHSIDLKGTLFTTSAAGTEKTPITVYARLLERPLAPRGGGPGLSDEERDKLIAELDPKDHKDRSNAVRRLQSSAADDHCSEVAEALIGCLDDPDLFVRWGAVDALKVWADTDSIPPLCNRALVDPEHAVRWATLECLGVLKDPRSAEPLAARLDSPDEGFVSAPLIKLGPPAEAAVIPYLKDQEWTVRMDACKVLGQIGGFRSVHPLQALSRDENGIVQGAAMDALKAIYQRLQQQRLEGL